jgi:hypothetical protein
LDIGISKAIDRNLEGEGSGGAPRHAKVGRRFQKQAGGEHRQHGFKKYPQGPIWPPNSPYLLSEIGIDGGI